MTRVPPPPLLLPQARVVGEEEVGEVQGVDEDPEVAVVDGGRMQWSMRVVVPTPLKTCLVPNSKGVR